MSIVGERIKQRRILMDWTQEVVGKKANTTKHVISNWERGTANPDYKQIILLTNAFNVTADYLLGLTEQPEPQFRDPFGQLSIMPMIDYSFINESSWDLIKLLTSGVNLSVDDFILSMEDKLLFSSYIKLTIERILEIEKKYTNTDSWNNDRQSIF